jgi:hypothetical protein
LVVGVAGLGRESVEAHLAKEMKGEQPVTIEFHIPSKRRDDGSGDL